tara:strand:+ start:290 stop:712 length:423 start_codon:yes stop_codon:yes gene_type:complete
MAAINLNTVRSIIETRLSNEFNFGQVIPIVFSNVDFDESINDEFIQCVINFGTNQYLTQNTTENTTNLIVGLITLDIFTKQGFGSGSNFIIGDRIRNLFNRIVVTGVRFDAPIGPEIFQSTIEGKFQTQIRITFELYETI